MYQEEKKEDYTLIKIRDPGLPSFTFFWMKEEKIVSPYFDKEEDAVNWKKQEREKK